MLDLDIFGRFIMEKRQNTIAANAFFNILYKLANVLFPIFSSAYTARILLADGVGRAAAANNNVTYFIILATLGIPAYGIREAAKRRNDREELSELFSELMLINTGLTIFACILFFVSLKIVPVFQQDIKLYLVYGVSIIWNFINVEWLYYGLEQYQFIAIRSIIIRAVALVMLVVFVHSVDDIYYFAAITVFATFGNYLSNICRARKYVSFSISTLKLRQHLKPLLFLALVSISTELYARIDLTMLDIMKENSIVGYYSYSHRLVNLIISLLVSITAVFLPRLAYYYETDTQRFGKLLQFGTGIVLLLSLPAAAGVSLVSSYLLETLFGFEFIQAAPILCILSIIIPIKCVGDLVCFQVLFCAGKESILMISYFIAMVINFSSNLFLIPRYGAEGAAVASVVSEVFAFIFMFCFSNRFMRWKIDVKGIVLIVLSIIFMSLSIILANRYIPAISFIKLIIDVCIGAIVYILINLVTKNPLLMTTLSQVKNWIKTRR